MMTIELNEDRALDVTNGRLKSKLFGCEDRLLHRRYKLSAMPFTILIGRDGKIAAIGEDSDFLGTTVKNVLGKDNGTSSTR